MKGRIHQARVTTHQPLYRMTWVFLCLTAFAATSWAADAVGAGAASAGEARLFHWHPFLAPFHAVVLHLPIGFLTLGVILEFYRRRRSSDELKHIVRLVIWLSLLSAVATAAFGLLRASGGGYDPRAVELHRWFGLAVPLSIGATLIAQRLAYRGDGGFVTFGYRASLAGTLGLLVVAGHLGGNLTHGAGYLVENAPAFVRELLEPARAPQALASKALTEQQRFYAEKVEPVFKARCQRCHGPEKQKGGYRLDDPVLAVKGGGSGKAAIKPGDVLGSNLCRLILLPPDHDDVMPPSGKEPLKLEELMNIVHWIRTGAVFASANPLSPGAPPATPTFQAGER